MNILDTIKGAGLSGGIAIIGLLYPPAKPLIDQWQKDVADGKITEENFEATIDTGIDFIEGFTPDAVDAFLEQCKKVVHECIIAEKLGVIAFTKS